MDVYDQLGVRKLINGYATLTRLGGSTLPSEVVAAMADASRHFVDLDELQHKAGDRIAEMTRNEAAYVSCGAAAGMVLSAAACMAGMDPEKRCRLPDTEGMKNEFIVHRHGRVEYDFAIRQAGGRLVEIGGPTRTDPREMEGAITEKTAGVFYFYNPARIRSHVPMEEAVGICRERGVPLIVDAAAQLPPVENLWRFTEMGADLVLFSGGKGLRGPQSSGLILGRRDLIEACAFHACPRHFIGRPMKVGKEEIVGLMAAVERYLGLDHEGLIRRYEEQVRYLAEELSRLPGLEGRRDFPSEAGQPMPRAVIDVDERVAGIDRDFLLERLAGGEPGIILAPAGDTGVFINPQTLEPGQERVVASSIRAILGNERASGG
jgi:uncharacterized pyridoxal phosphate-dependent enzyme